MRLSLRLRPQHIERHPGLAVLWFQLLCQEIKLFFSVTLGGSCVTENLHSDQPKLNSERTERFLFLLLIWGF